MEATVIPVGVSAGTLESSDIFITLEPLTRGVELELESVVLRQFGEEIRKVIYASVEQQGVDGVRIRAVDRGALECVINARMETALRRWKEGGQ